MPKKRHTVYLNNDANINFISIYYHHYKSFSFSRNFDDDKQTLKYIKTEK